MRPNVFNFVIILWPLLFSEYKVQYTILHQFEEALIVRRSTILCITKKIKVPQTTTPKERKKKKNTPKWTMTLNNKTFKYVLCLHWDYLEPSAFCKVSKEEQCQWQGIFLFSSLLVSFHLLFKKFVGVPGWLEDYHLKS